MAWAQNKLFLRESNPYPMGYQSHTNPIPISSDWKGIGIAFVWHSISIGMLHRLTWLKIEYDREGQKSIKIKS